MTRNLVSPSSGSTIVDKLKPYEGGTGQTSAIAALAAMDVVALSQINVPGGIAGLDANGQVLVSQVPDNGIATIGLSGLTTIGYNAPSTYIITNYDRFTTYTLTAINGTVYREKDTITYVPPAAAGPCGFILNGKTFNITAVGAQPVAPQLAVAFTFGYNATATMTTSAYAVTFGTFTHLNSDWQIATDAAFSNIVASSMADATNKISWSIGTLSLSTTYYFRARHRDSNGVAGNWSDIQSLTSKAKYNVNTEEAKLLDGDPVASEQFGTSVSMSFDGSRIVIGSPPKVGTYTNQGAAYVFLRAGGIWTQEAKIMPSDPAASDNFGKSVSMTADGTRVVIGAGTKVGTYNAQGAVYVFLRTGVAWAQEAKLLAGDPAVNDNFGTSVSVAADGSRVAITAPVKVGSVAGQGAAYIFLRTGVAWAQEAKLVSGDPIANESFGKFVSMTSDGTRVVVGANAKTGSFSLQGAAYVFTRTGTAWAQEAKLLAGDPAASDQFGISVSIAGDGTRIAVGAYGKNSGAGANQGAVYIFVRSGSAWAQEVKLLASDPAVSDRFGASVSLSSDGVRMIVGAYSKVGSFSAQGAAYSFARLNTLWGQLSKLTSSDPVASENFGFAACFSGDGTRVAIGAYNKLGIVANQGAVYIEV